MDKDRLHAIAAVVDQLAVHPIPADGELEEPFTQRSDRWRGGVKSRGIEQQRDRVEKAGHAARFVEQRIVRPQWTLFGKELIAVAGQIQHVEIRVALTEAPRQLRPGDVRHAQVDHHQIERSQSGEDVFGFSAVSGGRRRIARPGERLLDEGADHKLVIDDQDTGAWRSQAAFTVSRFSRMARFHRHDILLCRQPCVGR
jgi:hypothetical protein